MAADSTDKTYLVLTAVGADPIAITDNLNFGNPYKPENFWQLREAVEGIAEAE